MAGAALSQGQVHISWQAQRSKRRAQQRRAQLVYAPIQAVRSACSREKKKGSVKPAAGLFAFLAVCKPGNQTLPPSRFAGACLALEMLPDTNLRNKDPITYLRKKFVAHRELHTLKELTPINSG